MRHGYLLALGHEDENLYPSLRGEMGARRFFKRRGIKWHRSHRSGDTPGEAGPTRNMASSQIKCVNFLLPLTAIPGAVAAVVRAIDSDVRDIVEIAHNDNTSPVEFEWIGLECSLEGGTIRGANNTSVDAFVVAGTATGRRAYLMEWKYTEDYRGAADKGRGDEGATRRGRYAERYAADASAFSGAAPMEELLYEPFYQLMRLRLLADRMVSTGELDVSEAKVVLVVPSDNTAFRNRITSPSLASRLPTLKTVSDVMGATLKHPDQALSIISPSLLRESIERECGVAASSWAAYQRDRYG